MLLALDVGNTNIVCGVFSGEDLVARWRLATDRERTADQYGLEIWQHLQWHGCPSQGYEAILICSVVPPLMDRLREMSLLYFGKEPLVVGENLEPGLPIAYENPKEVGADRVINALAALHRYGAPCLVVDFGTATTVDAVSAEGVYVGGAIAPGVELAAGALFQRAARLPRIELAFPQRAIGRNTVESMQSGILFGYVGLVKELVARCREELAAPDAPVIATGGLAGRIAPYTGVVDAVEPDLTLWGLRDAYHRSRGG